MYQYNVTIRYDKQLLFLFWKKFHQPLFLTENIIIKKIDKYK